MVIKAKESTSTSPKEVTTQIICYKCQEPGHKANICNKTQVKRKESNNNNNNNGSKTTPAAVVASSSLSNKSKTGLKKANIEFSEAHFQNPFPLCLNQGCVLIELIVF